MSNSETPKTGRYALFPLRVGLALVFLVYGWNKFADLGGVAEMFEGWGIPLPAVSATLVAVAEVFGGLGLLLGVLPRFSAGVLSVVMATALLVVKVPGPLVGGFDVDVALLAGTLTILVNGAGRPTVWTLMGSPGSSGWELVKRRLSSAPTQR